MGVLAGRAGRGRIHGLLHWVFAGVMAASGASAQTLPVVERSASAYDSELVLPRASTVLTVGARQAHEGPNPLIYRWLKVGGPPLGEVEFFPNGSEHAHATSVTFTRPVPGTYTFRVIIGNGSAETISEVDVSVVRSAGARESSVRAADTDASGVVRQGTTHVLVKFAGPQAAGPQLSPAFRAALDGLGARVSKLLMQGRLGLVELPAGTDVRRALDVLEALPEIEYAEEDQPVKLDGYVPNDPLFSSQWALETASDADVDAPLAWAESVGNGRTLVAVMDTGVDYTHEDLYLAIAINQEEIPASLAGAVVDTNGNGRIDFYDLNSLDGNGDVVLNGSGQKVNGATAADLNDNGYIDAGDLLAAPWADGADGDGNGFVDDLTGWDHMTETGDVMDVHGHGTHVTGILAARGDNGIGIAGVNWRIRILPEKFHSGDGGSVSGAIAAIEHAVLAGAKVISASWGTPTNNAALRDAVEWAGDNGVILVVAAGNQSSDIDNPSTAYYPAAYADLPRVLSVASIDPDGRLSSFSNFGDAVDLAAPGASVLSAGLDGSYVHWSGTSMAVPHVAGVASLLSDAFPHQSPDWVVSHILATVKPLPDLAGKVESGGTVSAYAALGGVSGSGPRVVSAEPNGDVEGVSSDVRVTFDRAIAASTFDVEDSV